LNLLALTVLDLDLLPSRHLDLVDVVLHVEALDPGLEVGLDPVLVAGVRMHHVPVSGRVPQLLPQLRDRVEFGLLFAGRLLPSRSRRRRLVLGGTSGLVVLRHACSLPLRQLSSALVYPKTRSTPLANP